MSMVGKFWTFFSLRLSRSETGKKGGWRSAAHGPKFAAVANPTREQSPRFPVRQSLAATMLRAAVERCRTAEVQIPWDEAPRVTPTLETKTVAGPKPRATGSFL